MNAVAFAPAGRLLASAGRDGTVRLWNPATGRQRLLKLVMRGGWLRRIAGYSPYRIGVSVNAVAFPPDGRLLAGAGDDGTVRLWNPATGAAVGDPLTGHHGSVNAVAFAPDGRLLASAGMDGTVRLWNPATGTAVGDPLTGHHDSVTAVAFALDGRLLTSAGDDGTVRLWNPATGTGLSTFPTGDPIGALSYGTSGIAVGSASTLFLLRVASPDAGRPT